MLFIHHILVSLCFFSRHHILKTQFNETCTRSFNVSKYSVFKDLIPMVSTSEDKLDPFSTSGYFHFVSQLVICDKVSDASIRAFKRWINVTQSKLYKPAASMYVYKLYLRFNVVEYPCWYKESWLLKIIFLTLNIY